MNKNAQKLSDRMKEYEAVYDHKIMRRCPIIIRCDGRSFHTVTKSLKKPSMELVNAISNTAYDVAKDIEGCVFGYAQSDELTFVLKNDQSNFSMPWFDNRIQKMVSIAAAECTYHFNKHAKAIGLKLPKAIFDARVFSVPSTTELINALIYRQRDCIRNAASTAIDAELTRKLGKKEALKLLNGKKTKERIQLLYDICGIDFYKDYPSSYVRGVAVYKTMQPVESNGVTIDRMKWIIDSDIPEFEKDSIFILEAYV